MARPLGARSGPSCFSVALFSDALFRWLVVWAKVWFCGTALLWPLLRGGTATSEEGLLVQEAAQVSIVAVGALSGVGLMYDSGAWWFRPRLCCVAPRVARRDCQERLQVPKRYRRERFGAVDLYGLKLMHTAVVVGGLGPVSLIAAVARGAFSSWCSIASILRYSLHHAVPPLNRTSCKLLLRLMPCSVKDRSRQVPANCDVHLICSSPYAGL